MKKQVIITHLKDGGVKINYSDGSVTRHSHKIAKKLLNGWVKSWRKSDIDIKIIK